MPKLKFNEKPYYNADQIADALDADDIFNVYLELTPDIGYSIRRRPGMTEFADLGAVAGDGVFEWEAAGKVIVVNSGTAYELSSDGTYADMSTDDLAVGTPAIFADGSKLDGSPFLQIANGKLVQSDDGADFVYPTDSNTPDTATHVVYLNLRFLANIPSTNRFRFTDTNPSSGVLEPDYWSSSDNPLTAEAKGDNLVAMLEYFEEILNFGSQSIEVWQDDGVTPFSRLPQATSIVGVEAPYSLKTADNSVFGLFVVNGVRTVIRLTNRSPKSISEPIASILAGYSTVSDAIGQVISVGGVLLYMLQFPTEGKTWVYDIKGDVWTPWGTWNKTTGTMRQFIGQHSCYVKAWNKHLILSNVDGKVYEFDRSVFEDDGNIIKSYRRIPWEDHGTGKRKRSNKLRIKLKNGASADGSAFLRMADNGDEEWSEYIELSISPTGKRDFIEELTNLGIYHSRKYEISITDSADLCVVWAEEDVKELKY